MTTKSKIKWAQARPGERIGAGFFVFRRHKTSGRIAPDPNGRPFEHETRGRAEAEALRLALISPGTTFVVAECVRVAYVEPLSDPVEASAEV